MIKVENIDVYGWEAAIRGMRNPKNSWELSDTKEFCNSSYLCKDCEHGSTIGEKDLSLMKRLVKAGTDHSKFMRMIIVTCDIVAPLYWWKEMDTYKVGTVRDSCSTMHKITEKEFSVEDFSTDRLFPAAQENLKSTIDLLNYYRIAYLNFDGLSEDHACLLEQDLIEKYKATDRRYGYNQKSGGEKGSQLNDEVRQRMSENKKKYYLEHPEARENISLRVKGFKHSDEARIKMSIAAKNRHYKLTDEWKQKIGDANKKRLMSDLKLYEDAVNRCIQNGMKTANPVIQFDMNGVEIARYKSCKDAGKENGLNGGNISRCCKGRCKTCGGYKWQYANEYNNDREVV